MGLSLVAGRAALLGSTFGATFGLISLASPAFLILGSWVFAPFVWYGVDTRSGLQTIFSRMAVCIAFSIALLVGTALLTAWLTRQKTLPVAVMAMPAVYVVAAALAHAALWGMGFTSLVE
jgi:hypothetical protein